MPIDGNDLPAAIPTMCHPPVAFCDLERISSAAVNRGRDPMLETGPISVPKTAPVGPEDAEDRDIKQQQEDESKRLRDLLRPPLEDGSEVWRLISRVWMAIVIGVAGVCGWFICAQLVQVIAIVAAWDGVAGTGAWLLLGVFTMLVVLSVVRVIVFWSKYRKHRPMARLEERKQLRSFAAQKDRYDDAKKQLIAYMRDYKLDEPDDQRFLQRKGIGADDLKTMMRACQSLCHENNRQDFGTWIEAVEAQFVRPVDDAAARLVRNYAVLTALKTAICPYALLDIAVVIYMGAGMLGSLSRLYKISAGPFATLYLLGLVLVQALFAGRVEEHSDDMEQWLDESLKEMCDQAGQAIPDLVANLLGKLTAKASQGLANGLLLHRIGREACRLLRPLPMATFKK